MWEGLGAALANVGGSIYSANKQAKSAENAAKMQAEQQAAMNRIMAEQMALAKQSYADQLAQRSAGQSEMEQGLAQSVYGTLGQNKNQNYVNPNDTVNNQPVMYARL